MTAIAQPRPTYGLSLPNIFTLETRKQKARRLLTEAGINTYEDTAIRNYKAYQKDIQQPATRYWRLLKTFFSGWTIYPTTAVSFIAFLAFIISEIAIGIASIDPVISGSIAVTVAAVSWPLFVITFTFLLLLKLLVGKATGSYDIYDRVLTIIPPAKWNTIPFADAEDLPTFVAKKIADAVSVTGSKSVVTIDELRQDGILRDPIAYVDGVAVVIWEDTEEIIL